MSAGLKRMFWTMPVVMLFAVMLMTLPGCNDQQIADMKAQVSQVQQQVDKYAPLLEDAQNYKAQVDTLIASLPDGSAKDKAKEISAQLDSYIPKLQDIVMKGQETINRLNDNLKNATTTLDVVESGVNAAAPLVPGWGSLIALASTTIIGFIRAFQNKQAAVNIAKSVQPAVNLAVKIDPKISKIIDSAQTNYAGKLVDQSQTGVGSILPI